ncbi:TDG/mug DNA glycosylase family protein [Bacillus mesophilus]|uniref:Mismatch-specific DNA-glycosylase n=1 Tax=Bacillus mesophilus TaxID=1808955 RepID=A0A6M0Q939_9BACI|nr:mismatch-specific DNA-glycosylase [Bacillus mesophilus]MBM7662511.1 TDG/mug DNA glycosylase family protein [Bacillus mesophilus]NEY72864.1 mismatch-specific DNA-glycosylase [Bacillus mesophilus]
MELNPIPDHLAHNLNIVFIGFNPSIRSGETGNHFSNPSNRFWKILHESGITPRLYTTNEDRDLLKLGYGLTNIVERPTKEALEITKEEYEEGRQLLKQKLSKYKPKVACYVGKGVYQEFSKQKKIKWGAQPESMVEGVIDFVAPSSSGLVRMRLDEIVSIYKQIHDLIET